MEVTATLRMAEDARELAGKHLSFTVGDDKVAKLLGILWLTSAIAGVRLGYLKVENIEDDENSTTPSSSNWPGPLVIALAALSLKSKTDELKMELDDLIPLPRVWRMFGVSSMTGYRWRNNPKLEFPQTIWINGRCYVSRQQLQAWKDKLMIAALRGR